MPSDHGYLRSDHISNTFKVRPAQAPNPKLPTGPEPEFRDMNQFSGIGVVSLEFRVQEKQKRLALIYRTWTYSFRERGPSNSQN